jgi:hypothetical protein
MLNGATDVGLVHDIGINILSVMAEREVGEIHVSRVSAPGQGSVGPPIEMSAGMWGTSSLSLSLSLRF